MNEDKAVVLREFNNRTQADIAVNLLSSFGIESWILSDDLGGAGPAQSLVQGVQLMVGSDEAEAAAQILEVQEVPDSGV